LFNFIKGENKIEQLFLPDWWSRRRYR